MSAIGKVLKACKKIKNRNIEHVFLSLTEEQGELATELAIHVGHSQKKPDVDGVKGEAVDVILCALDILFLAGVSEKEIKTLMKTKTKKWLASKGKKSKSKK